LDITIKSQELSCAHTILSYETALSFMFRDMDKASQMTDIYRQHFGDNPMFTKIYNVFYEGLVACHFSRETADNGWRRRVDEALTKFQGWLSHSEWNWENKM
jgi:hypothetical protein